MSTEALNPADSDRLVLLDRIAKRVPDSTSTSRRSSRRRCPTASRR